MRVCLFLIAAMAFAASLAMQPGAADAQTTVKKYPPLKGVIYGKKRRPGGYTYKYADAIDTRKFNDPALSYQTQGGPFDNGFFFETPRAPFGGQTPYMH